MSSDRWKPPNVETYPLESVRVAGLMAVALPEGKEAARQHFVQTLIRESKDLADYIIRKRTHAR